MPATLPIDPENARHQATPPPLAHQGSPTLGSPTPGSLTPGSLTLGSTQLSVAIYLHDLSGGGVERQTLIIADALRQHGVHVTLVLHRLRGPLASQLPPDMPVLALRGTRTLTDIPRLARFLRSARPDILLANTDLNNVAALLARAVSRTRTKVVICQHNPMRVMDLGPSRLYRHVPALYRALRPLISRAVGVSAGVSQELTRLAGLPAERVASIPNPALGPDFAIRAARPAEHPWFEHRSTPLFITAGRLVSQKDHATLLRALALHRQHHDSRLIILGDGPLRPALQALIEQLNLDGAVDMPGFQENPLPFFRRADAFVLSSCHEGFGNVLVEAMACGTPVISTSCPHGPAEILGDGRFGMLVPPHDPEALAAAMDQVATLPERFPPDLLRRRASDFDYQVCADRYLALFQALVPDRQVTPVPAMAA